jgi:hypothetical protein
MPSGPRKGLSLNYRNKKLLESVRELPCQVCGIEDGTIVAAHSNQLRHGKGKSIKAHDWAIAAMCHTCHTQIDQGGLYDKQTRFGLWDRAFERTLHLLWERGIIEVR